jgi:hypothetical protein
MNYQRMRYKMSCQGVDLKHTDKQSFNLTVQNPETNDVIYSIYGYAMTLAAK